MTENNELERMWKEVVMTNLKYYSGTCLDRLRKPMKNINQGSQQPT
jgi:hypothetical protein